MRAFIKVESAEEATRTNDIGRVELAQRDRDYVVAELARAVGLGGRVTAQSAARPSAPEPA